MTCDKPIPLLAMFLDRSNIFSNFCKMITSIVTISAKSCSILTIGFRGKDVVGTSGKLATPPDGNGFDGSYSFKLLL